MSNKTNILSTVLLDQPLINKANEAGVTLDAMSFIQVVDITDENDLQEQLEELYRKKITAVFTSVNAVRAVFEQAFYKKPNWKVYCIGHATRNAILEYFDVTALCGIANDAAALAAIIKQNGEEDVFFFCGDKRMDTLCASLEKTGVGVHEVIVYQTVEVPKFVEKDYDGILFFSPSGVNSFFSMNTIDADTVLFAIGGTTAKAIKEMTDNKVVESELPSKEQLVERSIQYFQKRAIAGQ
jgi:uroporphyrinogen-III synthase